MPDIVTDTDIVEDASGNLSLASAWHIPYLVSNTNVLTNIVSQVIPAGKLILNSALLILLDGNYFNNTTVNQTLRVQIGFGGTTIWDATSSALASSTTIRSFSIFCVLTNENPLNLQRLAGIGSIGDIGAATTGLGTWGTVIGGSFAQFGGQSAVNTNSAQTLSMSLQHSATAINLTTRGTVTALLIP